MGRSQMKGCWRFLLGFILLALNLTEAQDLRPGGAHVCSETVSYNTYVVQTLTRIGYENYRTCCKRILRACVDRCTRYRTRTEQYTNNVLQVNYKQVYLCCTGWARSGDECPLPICNPGCQNGQCINPNQCQCRPGFEGSLCEHDIDECSRQPGICSQVCTNHPGTYSCSCQAGFVKTDSNPQVPDCHDVNECDTTPCQCPPGLANCQANCHNTVGTFYCSCKAGFTLTGDQRNCIDVDECSTGHHSCQQNCHNNPGSYTCSCNTGYLLTGEHNCADVDECATLNGGCNQICANSIGSYQCQCQSGYRLMYNQKTCVDIDECVELRPCDNEHGTCENIPGRYTCGCQIGWVLQADQKTCLDLDECASPTTNGCMHNCNNNPGSYSCSCNIGYRLNDDLRRCDDIDECAEKSHACQHNCHNNVGSYTCSCRPGYKLDADARLCIALPCETIAKPLNGQMSCTGFVTDEWCTFACDTGFDLFGTEKRMCQHTATWSGIRATCERKPCPELEPPQHGSLMIPCILLYNSTCISRCSRGYYLVGDDQSTCIMGGANTVWAPNNATCEVSQPCTPNPCQHSGKCLQTSERSFSCDCTGTNYKGSKCETGMIYMPSFPQLVVGEPTEDLLVLAWPTEALEIRPFVADGAVTFSPPSVTIYPSVNEAFFKVTANKPGMFTVKFAIVGSMALVFESPREQKVYAYEKVEAAKAVDLGVSFPKQACHNLQLSLCNPKVNLASTCKWEEGSTGFVSVLTPTVSLPLSINGLSKRNLMSLETEGLLFPVEQAQLFLQSRSLSSKTCQPRDTCPKIAADADAANFIARFNLFQRAYLNQLSALLPPWLRLKVQVDDTNVNVNNLVSALGTGEVLSQSKQCSRLDLNPLDTYSLYTPVSTTIFHFLSSIKANMKSYDHLCIAVDICNGASHVVLPQGQYLSFDSDLDKYGVGNVKVMLEGFTIMNGRRCLDNLLDRKCINFASSWKLTSHVTLHGSSTVQFNGTVYSKMDSLELFPVEKFSKTQRFLYKGSLDYNIRFKMFGGILGIAGQDRSAEAYAELGGVKTCSLCEDMGLMLSIKTQASSLKYDTQFLKFSPSSRSTVWFPADWKGGMVKGVQNANKLKLQLRLYLTVDRLFSALDKLINASYPADARIIQKNAANLNQSLHVLQDLFDKGSSSLILDAVGRIDSLKENVHDCEAVVNSLLTRIKSDPERQKIVSAATLVLRRLREMDFLTVESDFEAIVQRQDGLVFSYNGGICLYDLCLSDVDVIIRDLPRSAVNGCPSSCKAAATHTKFADDEFIYITAVPKTNMDVSRRIRVGSSGGFTLKVSKTTNEITGSFAATVKYFNKYHDTMFEISKDKVSFESKNVTMDGVTADGRFTISAEVDLASASWESLVHRLNGRSDAFSTVLMASAQRYFQETYNKTASRLNSSISFQQRATENLIQGHNELLETQKQFKIAEDEFRNSDASYKRHLTLLQQKQAAFDSYIADLNLYFIEKDLNRVCKLQSCGTHCVAMPQCQLCSDPVIVEMPVVKCWQSDETIRTSQETPYTTSCDVTKYAFIPIYTGSCSPDPRITAQAQQQLQKSLVATGSAVGAMVGSVIPGVGTVLGGLIGGVVGFVSGLFNSCDESYEVLTKKWTEQVECTLIRSQIVTVIRPVSTCDNVMKKVESGFDEPRVCNCTTNNCIARLQDQDCLLDNANCEKQRKVFLSSTAKPIPSEYSTLYEQIKQYQENVATSRVQVERSRKSKDFYQRELERAQNFERNKHQESKYANASQEDVRSILGDDLCIHDRYLQESDLSKLMTLADVTFDVALPLENNIELAVEIKNLKDNGDLVTRFVYNLETDRELSIQAGARKSVVEALCKNVRRRRSVDGAFKVTELSFKAVFDLHESNASASRIACATFAEAINFLAHSLDRLSNATKAAWLLKQQVDSADRTMASPMSRAFHARTSAPKEAPQVVKLQRDLLATASQELNVVRKRTELKDVFDGWLEQQEVHTSLRNYSSCLNFIDCVEFELKNLHDLPSMLSVPRSTFVSAVEEIQRKFASIPRQTDIASLYKLSGNINQLLKALDGMSLHCEGAPNVTLLNPELIDVGLGDTVELKCSANSKLPFRYFWTRNDVPIDEEYSSNLVVNVTEKSEGGYKCVVISQAGAANSTTALITGHRAPRFVEYLTNQTYFIPSAPEVKPVFACNATGTPAPTFEWFFRRRTDALDFRMLPDQRSSILQIDAPDGNHSGFYFCRASNSYGSVQSNVVRLDVRQTILANQSFRLFFNAKDATNVSAESLSGLFSKMKEQVKEHKADITVQLAAKDNRTVMTLEVSVHPQTRSPHPDIKEMLVAASKSRQDIANAAAVFLSELLTHHSQLPLDDGWMLAVDNETVDYNFRLNICRSGYSLHSNGYTCAECPAGSFGPDCEPCPKDTFQARTGQETCRKCTNGTLTETTGSANESLCIEKRLQKLDIIFVLDTTWKLFKKTEYDVKRFINGFVVGFTKAESSVRYGIVTYSSHPLVYSTLEGYNGTDELLFSLHHVRPERKDEKHAKVGLEEAARIFHDESGADRKKVAIVITNGFSTGEHFTQDGFLASKHASDQLQLDGVHVISVAMSDHKVDDAELRAIASYPKSINAIFPVSLAQAVQKTFQAVDNLLEGKCYAPQIDVGILLQSKRYFDKSEYNRDELKFKSLMTSLYGQSQGEYTFNFLQDHPLHHHSHFVQYKSATVFVYDAIQYHYQKPRLANLQTRIQYAVDNEFDERHFSLGNNKLLIVITSSPIKRPWLENSSGVHVINLVYDASLVDPSEALLDFKQERKVFAFEEAKRVLENFEKKLPKVCL